MDTQDGLVMVVDDEASVRQIAASVLRRCGYEVLSAPDAPSALEQLAEHPRPLELLLTDVVLPGTRGDELARTLRSKHPALRVVFMSGYEEDELSEMGVTEVGNAYLTKPFTTEVLMLMVQGAMA
ncbi:MAG: response regulator [Longimicrobiales bacterium]|nr:response regulator [Longimicrobiales bacterium]